MWGKIDNLSQMASFYLERTKVIESNIANADTPGYKPKDLVFEKMIDEHLSLRRDDPRHMDPDLSSTHFREVTYGDIRGYDDNRVDVQEQLAKLAESSIMYKALGENLKKEFAKLKLAITGR